jgi:hypothetical protein
MEQPTSLFIQSLFKVLTPLIPVTFTGQIEINCFKGGISNINLKQSYKENAK